MPEAEFIQFIIKNGFQVDPEDINPSDSVEAGTANLEAGDSSKDELGAYSKDLTAPVNIKYNSGSFALDSDSSGNTVNVTLVFDKSLYKGDALESIQYRAFVGSVDPLFAAQDSSAAFDGIKPISSSTISVTNKTSSLITLKWKGLANATSYSVHVKGKNLPAALGTSNTDYVKTSSKTYMASNSLTGGYKYINLKAASGKAFDGDYTFNISVFYDGHGTSAAVEKKVLNV